MAKILKGKPVADKIISQCGQEVSRLINETGIAPGLAVLSVGDNSSNESYLRGISKKAEEAGVILKKIALDEDIMQKELLAHIANLNRNKKINGILMMRPLPANSSLDEAEACESIATEKDVDSANSISSTSAYLAKRLYAPCTAEACMKILRHYEIPIAGKNVCVIGRSLIVGKPLANLLLNANATVTVCHSYTADIAAHTKNADIIIVATGTPRKFDAAYFAPGQTVIDAGINWDAEAGRLVGDVEFESVAPIVGAITPVPGGVGSVTSAILIKHVVF